MNTNKSKSDKTSNRKQKNKNVKSVKIILSPEDDLLITSIAKEKKVSKQHYMKTKLLDSNEGLNEFKNGLVSDFMPEFYELVRKIKTPPNLKDEFMDYGRRLWPVVYGGESDGSC